MRKTIITCDSCGERGGYSQLRISSSADTWGADVIKDYCPKCTHRLRWELQYLETRDFGPQCSYCSARLEICKGQHGA